RRASGLLLLLRPPPISRRFPYATLFRSMPVNDAYPLEVLIPACRRYQKTTGRRISFEYSMVRGVNDSPAMARKLAGLIRGMGAQDRKSTRLNSSHVSISYDVFCLNKKNT